MKSSEYWKKRALSAKKKQLEASADYEAAMQSRLRDLEHDIEKEALGYLQRYANENNVGLKQAASVLGNINSTKWSMTLEEFERKAKAGGYEKELNAEYYKSRIFRLQQLHEQMVEFSKKYGIAEQLRMQKGLAKQYQNSYYLDAYNKYRATGQLDIKLNHFNEQQLENIVYRPWKGSDFSKRIWKEYTEVLPDELTDALLRGTLFGYSPSKVVRMMRDRFQKVSERDLHRLVITEMGHAAEEATAQFYKDSDIEQYQYLATLESHTCDQCAHLDERIFNVKDKKEGINYPLIHPYCRCTTVPYEKDLPDIETRWSRDPKTGKGTYVGDMSFNKWKKVIREQQSEKEFNELIEKYGIHGFPKSVQEYRRLLYNKHTGRALNAYIKARKRGTVEPVVTYEDYQKAMNRLNKEVVGISASNGQQVKRFSDHLIDRIYGVRSDPQGHRREGVSIDEIKNMLDSKEIINLKNSTKFFSDQGYVVLNDKGNLVTVVPRRKKNA